MTGAIPPEVLEHLLDSLPVEISFVGADDAVMYYNKNGRRIFPRAPGVIGKKVQNCHPKESLDKVNAILDDFRAETKNSAEFWINMKGRLILIRYLAVRDGSKKYLGCLEATQDITDLKKIEGEKRLLD